MLKEIFKTKKQKQRYYNVVSTIFILIAALHFIRILNSWTLELGGYVIPMWMSWVVLILLIYLAVRGLAFGAK